MSSLGVIESRTMVRREEARRYLLVRFAGQIESFGINAHWDQRMGMVVRALRPVLPNPSPDWYSKSGPVGPVGRIPGGTYTPGTRGA